MPNKRSILNDWKPPFVCFADSPSLAWSLSGGLHKGLYPSWDLWMVWASYLDGYEILPFDNGDPKEYRVYHRIYKRHVWYVGTRESK